VEVAKLTVDGVNIAAKVSIVVDASLPPTLRHPAEPGSEVVSKYRYLSREN